MRKWTNGRPSPRVRVAAVKLVRLELPAYFDGSCCSSNKAACVSGLSSTDSCSKDVSSDSDSCDEEVSACIMSIKYEM